MEEKQLNAKVMTDNIRYSNVNLQKDFLEMGKGLFEYKVSKAFNGKFENFKTAIGEEFSLDTSTANGLIKIYSFFVEDLAIDEETLKEIGFDKLKQFIKLKKYMDFKALNIYIEENKNLPFLELKSEIKIYIDSQKEIKIDMKEEFKKTIYDKLTGFFNCSKKDLDVKLAFLLHDRDLEELDREILGQEEKALKGMGVGVENL